MRLDIMIPYWGDPEYMRQTVQSVLDQDDDRWNLTIVDDAYPSREVEEYVKGLDHPRIRFIRKEHNEGITANYATCLSLATEPLVVLLGSDDRMLPNYVRTILKTHQRLPEAAIIQPGVELIDDDGNVIRPLADFVKTKLVRPSGKGTLLMSGEELAVSLLNGNWLYWPALTFRTEAIRAQSFLEGFPLIQDLAIVLDMVYAGDELAVVPEVCFQYRRHAAGSSTATLADGTRFEGERRYYELAAENAKAAGWKKAYRAARRRLTSRLNSGMFLPRALLRRDRAAIGRLARHTFR